MDVTIEALAARQIADYRRLSPGSFLRRAARAAHRRGSLPRAAGDLRLRVQDGDRVAGYKVGCTSAEIERQFGLRGPILRRPVRERIASVRRTS